MIVEVWIHFQPQLEPPLADHGPIALRGRCRVPNFERVERPAERRVRTWDLNGRWWDVEGYIGISLEIYHEI